MAAAIPAMPIPTPLVTDNSTNFTGPFSREREGANLQTGSLKLRGVSEFFVHI